MTDEQRSEAWFKDRLGKVTASKVADVVAKTKTGYSASRENYLAQLVVERLTGQRAESYSNSAMQWGTDQEPFARAVYELTKGDIVEECGFVDHPVIPNTGASPDGLVGGDGLIEIKCPNTATHIETLLGGEIAGKYLHQMQWQMACTGRQWCDFVSFDPRMPEHLQLFIKRIERNNEHIAMLEGEINKFLAELDDRVARLMAI